jgi:serine/threonine protein kinase
MRCATRHGWRLVHGANECRLFETERQDWEREKNAVLASLQADRARMVELEEQLERKLAHICSGSGGGGGDGALVTKVVDFGMARYAPALLKEGRTHHTMDIVIGKKPYQPYEYTNRGHVSEKTGTFAFGVMLCELLTGEPPKDRESGEMLAAKMLEPLADSEHALLQLLDKRLGAGEACPLGRAVRLGYVAARCIKVMPEARCIVADVLPELTAIAGRKAIRRAGRGKKYDPMTGELVQIAAQLYNSARLNL